MALLIAGLALFIVVHLVPTRPSLRVGLVGTLGPGIYRGLFALVSIAGLVLIVLGYGHMQGLGRGNPQLWVPPVWIKHVVFLLMIPAIILLVAAYVPSRIRTAVGHPMLTALMIWAFAHLLANGDLASVLLFGSFLGFAVYDRISVIGRLSPGPLGNAKGGALHDIVVIAVGAGALRARAVLGACQADRRGPAAGLAHARRNGVQREPSRKKAGNWGPMSILGFQQFAHGSALSGGGRARYL